MRVSADDADSHLYEEYVDGEKQHTCILADDEEGYAWCHVTEEVDTILDGEKKKIHHIKLDELGIPILVEKNGHIEIVRITA